MAIREQMSLSEDLEWLTRQKPGRITLIFGDGLIKTKQNRELEVVKLENKTSIKVDLLHNTPKQRWDKYRNAPSFQNRTMDAMELESVSSAQITGTCVFPTFLMNVFDKENVNTQF